MVEPARDVPHYMRTPIQSINHIRMVLSAHEHLNPFVSYCLGQVLKYVHRCGHKGDPQEDLIKARDYLDWAIQSLEGGE